MNDQQYQPRGFTPYQQERPAYQQERPAYQQERPSYNQGGNGQQNRQQQERAPLPKPFFYKPFVVTSNRDVPEQIKLRAIELTRTLIAAGHIARVGKMDGLEADVCAVVTQNTECHFPWKNFADSDSKNNFNTPEILAIAKHFATGWDQVKFTIQGFMGKNVRLLLGNKAMSLAQFMICYTDDGAETTKEVTPRAGMCGHAIKVAHFYNIPVFNLKHQDCESRVLAMFGQDDKSRPMQITQDQLPD